MLKRLSVQGYKSLHGLDLELQPLSVLFGPNAAGKSNFLDALQLLSRIATSRTLQEAFEPPYRGQPLESFSFGEEGIRGLLRQESVRFTFEADIELGPNIVEIVEKQIRERKRVPGESVARHDDTPEYVREKNLRYRITIEILPKSGVLRVADEYLAALNAKGEPTQRRGPFISSENDQIRVRMEGQAHPTYYEKGLDHSILSRPHYPPHYPHLLAMREEFARWLFFYFEPRERMRAATPVKEVRHIGLMGEELASFLNTLKNTDEWQFNAIEKSLHAIIPSVTGIDVSVSNLGEVELRIKEGNLLIPARVVSEGTLRVLGLLALSGAKEPPSLIGFEEPENGIHPRRIQHIARMLADRARDEETQIIVTTHSPLMPDKVADSSLFICNKRLGKTHIQPYKNRTNGPLFRTEEIDTALASDEDGETPISERIIRGDFDV